MHPLIILTPPLLLSSGVAARYIRRKTKRYCKNKTLRRNVQEALGHLPCLEDRREIGAGNKGIVYDVKLGDRWQEQLGILWKTKKPFPERVVVKIVPAKPLVKLDALLHLAPKMEQSIHGPESIALCPFFAIGKVDLPGGDRSVLVEIMPLLEGETLSEYLQHAQLDDRKALQQLIQVLETSFFFERENCFERSIDDENVMVLSDGSWIRIDIDSTRIEHKVPRYRMIRMARLTQQVLENLNGTFDHEKIQTTLQQVRKTAKSPLKKYEGKPLPAEYQGAFIESPEELIEMIDDLMQ